MAGICLNARLCQRAASCERGARFTREEELIRIAEPHEAERLAALKRVTFRETFIEGFGMSYPAADLAAFEEASYAPARVRAELADPDQTSWVAEEEGRLLGYAKVGPCKLPHPDARERDGELHQIYVLGAAQGGGLGRALLDIALDHLAATRPGPVWLGVWTGNKRAQAFYRARGFAQVGRYAFAVGASADEDLIFRRG